MQWIKRFFTLPDLNHTPSHKEIGDKNDDITAGDDVTAVKIHEQKNKYTRDLLKLQKQIKIVEHSARQLSDEIDTAIAVAVATKKIS